MKKQLRFLTMVGLIGGLLHLSGCKKDDTIPLPTGIGSTTDPTLGSILTDNQGQTLYLFSTDVNGLSSCTSGCLGQWPIFWVANPTLANGLASTDFGEITRADGKKQTTFKGWPLYYFAPKGDGKLESKGETSGDGVDNSWFVAKANYTVMIASEQLVGADGNNYTSASVTGTEVSTFFVDGSGRTLYAFSNDTKDNNNFTAADFSNNGIWSVYETTLGDLPTGVNSADFETIQVAGHQQLVYKGHPLYFFGGTASVAGDASRGDTRGVSFPTPGAALWKVVNTSTADAPASVTITQNTTFGKILTDSKGRSLYFFTKDVDGTDHYCTAPAGTVCGGKWPIFYTDVVTVGDASLVATDFNVITLPNGTKQTTYKGWPLYYYSIAGDGAIAPAGNTDGDNFGNVTGANGLWFIAKPDYSLMVANAQLVGGDNLNYTSESILGNGASFYFVDGSGRTLYRFNGTDTNNKNTFTNGTAAHDAIWPIFYTPKATLSLPTGLNSADFAEITVLGQQQLTYKGWPLYYFGGNTAKPGDTVRGTTKGISFTGTPAPGVATPWKVIYTSTAAAQ